MSFFVGLEFPSSIGLSLPPPPVLELLSWKKSELFVGSLFGNEEFKKDWLDIKFVSRRPKNKISIDIIMYRTYNKLIIPKFLTIKLQLFIITLLLAQYVKNL